MSKVLGCSKLCILIAAAAGYRAAANSRAQHGFVTVPVALHAISSCLQLQIKVTSLLLEEGCSLPSCNAP
jgi:hypothetical protein